MPVARRGGGGGGGAPTRNLQNIKNKHVDQPAKICATPYCIHMLPMVNCCGCKQLMFKNVCTCNTFCAMLKSALCTKRADFVVLTKMLVTLTLTLTHTHTHTHTQYMYK